MARQVGVALATGKTTGGRRKRPRRKIIGWREWVALPDLGIARLKAKVDTGARTSALHALEIVPIEHEGRPWVRFSLFGVAPRVGLVRCQAPVRDVRAIRNTSGATEERYVIATHLVLGPRRWLIELSLTDRELMSHELILGRTSIRRHRLAVAPDRSYLMGEPGLR